MPDIPRLVCRPAPFPDESLLSWLVRLQAANGYDRLSWLTSGLRQWMGQALPTRLVRAENPEFLEALATLTEIPAGVVYRLTLNRYVASLLPAEIPVRQGTLSDGSQVVLTGPTRHLNHRLRADRATSFCPQCVAASRYHRLPWLLIPVFGCLQHGCWLREECSHCGASVSIVSVVDGSCGVCQTDLTAMPTLPLTPLAEATQRALMTLLELEQSPTLTEWPVLSVPACFRLLDGLMMVVRQLGWEWVSQYTSTPSPQLPFPRATRQALSVGQWGGLYSSTWAALQDWPHQFEKLLNAYRQQPKAYPGGGIRHELGNFYEVWLERNWNHPDFAPVQNAFNQYFVTHFPPSRDVIRLKRMQRSHELLEQFAYIDVRNAARSVGVSPPKIMRLVRDGYIRTFPERDAYRPGRFVYRVDLEPALAIQEDGLDYKTVAQEFGVAPSTLNEWLATGLLTRTATRRLRGEPVAVLGRADVIALQQRLAQYVQICPDRPVDAVNFKETCARNGKVGLNAVQVLERILAGKLRAYHAKPDLQPFSALWFAATDVAALTEQIKGEQGWMGFLEVWRLFAVSRELIHLWIEQGHLVPVATFARAQYFDRAQVQQFHQSLQTSHEVTLILHSSRSTLSQWVRAGFLPVVSGLGAGTGKQFFFDRTVIEAFHQRYITAQEIRKHWGDALWLSFRRAVRLEHFRDFPENTRLKAYLRLDVENFVLSSEQPL